MKAIRFKSKNMFLASIIILTTTIACKKEKVEPQPVKVVTTTTSDTSWCKFSFIKEGHLWKYKNTDPGSSDTSVNQHFYETKIWPQKKNGNFMVDYFDYFVDNGVLDPYIDTMTTSWIVEDCTWWHGSREYGKIPILSGDIYINKIISDEDKLAKIISTSANVVVPAGRFECVKIKYYESEDTTKSLVSYCYYSGTYGLIKTEWQSFEGKWGKMELIEKNF